MRSLAYALAIVFGLPIGIYLGTLVYFTAREILDMLDDWSHHLVRR